MTDPTPTPDHAPAADPPADAADAAAEAPALRALRCLDLTDLNDAATEADARALGVRARTPFGPVAAVCTWPRLAAFARETAPPDVRVACVAAFPSGDGRDEDAVAEAEAAIAAGADEIDLVIPWRELLEGRPQSVRARIERVRRAIGPACLKAILETGVMPDRRTMRAAADLALEGGADFLKTSTGRTPVGATLSAAQVLLEAVREADRPAGVKVSGGIRTVDEALAYLSLADEVMGAGWARPATFRLGASSLLDALTAELAGEAPAATGTETC